MGYTLKDGILTIEKAAEYMGVTEEEFEKLMETEEHPHTLRK